MWVPVRRSGATRAGTSTKARGSNPDCTTRIGFRWSESNPVEVRDMPAAELPLDGGAEGQPHCEVLRLGGYPEDRLEPPARRRPSCIVDENRSAVVHSLPHLGEPVWDADQLVH